MSNLDVRGNVVSNAVLHNAKIESATCTEFMMSGQRGLAQFSEDGSLIGGGVANEMVIEGVSGLAYFDEYGKLSALDSTEGAEVKVKLPKLDAGDIKHLQVCYMNVYH